jgi:hypothetical protein
LTEEDLKNIIYGSVRELVLNKKYFYSGYQSHFTEEGRRVLNEMLDLYAPKIESAIRQADDQRARDMVMKELKS